VTGSFINSPLRKTLLPTSTLMGDFLLSEHTVQVVFDALRHQSQQGPSSRGNEGLVFLAGWRTETLVFYSTVIAPRVRNDFGSVFVEAGEFGRCAKQARNTGLQILAQVHSHPGSCCHHSDGDDKLIILPFEGMLSVVVPNYAIQDVSLAQCGVHQYQRRTWCLCDDYSVRAHLITAPSSIRIL
jgi:proteasome lid subunit RPN8/RPN11